jgi:hypothetical protein
VAIYAHPNALPRVRIVHQFLPVPNTQQAQNELRSLAAGSPDAPSRRLADTVVLERDEEGHWPPRLDGGPADGDEAHIVEQEDADRLQLHVRTQTPGLVVVADTYYPGWVARVDGRRAPIYPANVMFRAVFVPAGAHTIELHYEPASFLWGMRLFAVALLGTVLLAAPWRSRRAPEPERQGVAGPSPAGAASADARRLKRAYLGDAERSSLIRS